MAKKKKAAAKKSTAKKSAKRAVAKKAAPKKAAPKQAASSRTSKAAAPASSPAPKGHISVAPGITANDAAASMKWYCDVLGFTVQERWEHEGQFRGGSVRSGDVVINIGQDDWKMGRDRVKGQGTRLYVQTNLDIDKYAADIKARGGNLDQEPMDGWGARSFGISDPDGFKLTFMKRGR
jgi:uncharacterized glyoxalase superfamily protein PhnB